MKTDIYSFSLLCVWILFLSHRDNCENILLDWRQQKLVLARSNDAISTNADKTQKERLNHLKAFLNATLVDDPKERDFSLTTIISRLSSNMYSIQFIGEIFPF